MNVFALDFDGVICDSARETGITAWRAGYHLWHHDSAFEPDAFLLQQFILLRPLIETGYEALLLFFLVYSQRILSENPPATSQFKKLCAEIMDSEGWNSEQLIDIWGQVRDSWIKNDFPSWLAQNRFYPGIIQALQTAEKRGDAVYILTTKQERFVHALLNSAAATISPERLFGLESGRKKEDILQELCRNPDYKHADLYFVEDRLPTLQRCMPVPKLSRVQFLLADWGYNSALEKQAAAAEPRIDVYSLPRFIDLLEGN